MSSAAHFGDQQCCAVWDTLTSGNGYAVVVLEGKETFMVVNFFCVCF